ncbi:MAG TPA: 50S ribosomal protein L24 [Firmicutes bacterium]|jgi:large subunit ribosomal protein L24|nr:50S ribosomal protein L24 [Bacillota bacterium]HAV20000.1 50S ribosomal protein L24 [Bacillota bacterium]
MKIKKGDKVIVIAGADKGKTGVIQKVSVKTNRVVVEGINVHKKHRKPKQNNPEGSIVEIYAPIDASNVALVDPKTKKATRVGINVIKGKKVRVTKASKSQLD